MADPKLTPIEVPAHGGPAARVVRWNRRVGDAVVANETLAVVEGPLGPIELPAPASGVLVRIDRAFGEGCAGGEVVGMLEVSTHATRLLPVQGIPEPEHATVIAPSEPRPRSVASAVLSQATAELPQGRAVSRKLAGFGTTIFTEMTQLANRFGAINLAQGFPDFDGPEFVKAAAEKAIRDGHGQYAPMAGAPALREAIAAKYERFYGLRFDPTDEVTVTSGATEAIFDAVQGLCDVGDEVVLFEPFYDSYKASVCMAGAIPRVVTLHTPDWRFDPDELRRAFGPRTRAVILNTPHNPTGKVFAREELELIAQQCVQHDVVCIADEVYEHLVYAGRHVPMATLPGMRARTITVSSLGKSYSLTGWKIGWAVAPKPLSAAVRMAHQFVTFAVALPLQLGAVAAVSAPAAYYDQLLAEYRTRKDLLVDGLTRAGLGVRPPQGSYFVCADIRALGHFDDVRFCRDLIEKVGVAAIPPSAFYERANEGKTYVRFAFCKKDETLRQAAQRLATLSAS